VPKNLNTVQDTLRHVLVALADRFEHAVEGVPEVFADFDVGNDTRRPIEIVRHLRGLLRFTTALWRGTDPEALEPEAWDDELAAFRSELRELDALLLAMPAPAGATPTAKILQGPLLDALTHVGQLLTLRRLAGAPAERRRYSLVDMAELDAPPT
jgi:NAD(P)H-dependent FMN reductase